MVNEADNLEPVLVKVNGHGKSVQFHIDTPTDYIQSSISRSEQFYELDLLNEVFHRTLPGMRFVDVGANIGNHTLFFSGIAGMEGTAIEPYEPNFRRLENNIKINDLDHKVEIHNIVLGENAGHAICSHIDKTNTGTVSFSETSESSEGRVDMVSLDGLKLEEFHFLKIDVEGMEIDVLRGARAILSKFRPLIFCEAQSQCAFMELRNFLQRYNYQPTRRFCVTPTYMFEPF